MNWQEILKRMKEAGAADEDVKAMKQFIQSQEEKAGKAEQLQSKVDDLAGMVGRLEDQKKEANGEAAEERIKNKGYRDLTKKLHEAGILNKDMTLAIPEEDLKGIKPAQEKLKAQETELSGFRQKERASNVEKSVKSFMEKAKYSSGLKILVEAAIRKGEEFKPEDEAATSAFLQGMVKDYGEEIFKVTTTAPAPPAGGGTPSVKTPGSDAGVSVIEKGAGAPAEVKLLSKRPGVPPSQAPTAAQFIGSAYERQNLKAPAAVTATAERAEDEKSRRAATITPTGADTKAGKEPPATV